MLLRTGLLFCYSLLNKKIRKKKKIFLGEERPIANKSLAGTAAPVKCNHIRNRYIVYIQLIYLSNVYNYKSRHLKEIESNGLYFYLIKKVKSNVERDDDDDREFTRDEYYVKGHEYLMKK